MEYFANNANTTLDGAYTSGSGTLDVIDASDFPAQGNFRISIFDQSTGDLVVILKVTAVSGNTFTVTAEGTDASASSGDIVRGTMVTAASVEELKGLVLIEEKVASASASLDFTNLHTDLFDQWSLELINLIPAADCEIHLRMSTNGGVSYDSGSNYGWGRIVASATWHGNAGSASATVIALGAGNVESSGAPGLVGTVKLHNLGSSTLYKMLHANAGIWGNDGNIYVGTTVAVYKSTSAVDAVQIIANSGATNISSGIARLYGMRK